jgi:hypothetical protein
MKQIPVLDRLPLLFRRELKEIFHATQIRIFGLKREIRTITIAFYSCWKRIAA